MVIAYIALVIAFAAYLVLVIDITFAACLVLVSITVELTIIHLDLPYRTPVKWAEEMPLVASETLMDSIMQAYILTLQPALCTKSIQSVPVQ